MDFFVIFYLDDRWWIQVDVMLHCEHKTPELCDK